jgi:AcrR family transcriptional regulator
MAAAVSSLARVREPSTHVERREEAERKLLAAAAKIIAVKGLEKFTLAEVGETAGYSRGLPRHYFGDKDELTIRVALYVAEHPILQERLEVEPGLATVISIIRFFFEVAPKYRTNVRALSIVLAGVLTNESLQEPIARMTRHKRETIAKHIAIGIERGEIRKDVNPEAQAILILAQMRGVVSQWLSDDASVDLKQVEIEFIETLRRGLAR